MNQILVSKDGEFKTIEEALEFVESGEAIFFGSGTFSGCTISKNVTIIGSQDSIINSDIIINNDDVTLKGFTLSGAGCIQNSGTISHLTIYMSYNTLNSSCYLLRIDDSNLQDTFTTVCANGNIFKNCFGAYYINNSNSGLLVDGSDNDYGEELKGSKLVGTK